MKKSIKANKINILEDDKINVKYVIHMADIHIHKREREEEYREVFNNLYQDIIKKNLKKDNSVIVVAGDIIHDKTDLHPISVSLAKDFFIGLCKITTVIVIPGNHDVSLINMAHNSLESILKNLDTDNSLFLLNNEGFYQYNNILFGHTRFGFSQKVLECKFKFDGYKCALYHGIINGAKDNNFEYKNTIEKKKYYTTNDFSDYDYVFLGDIHKHAFLKKNIAYSGSLIQQTMDESLDKGYILWDLKKSRGSFEKIFNNYGKIKIDIDEDGVSHYDLKKIPKNIEIRIDCKSLNRLHIDDIYKDLNLNNITINKKIDIMIGSHNKDTKIVIGGKEQNLNIIKNLSDVSKILLLKLKENKKLTDTQLKPYKTIIDDLLQNYTFNDGETKRKIKLISLEFNNISIFGENNKIDFTKFNNIMGINAPNSSGKSSFIDAIIYAIFEESTRGSRFDLLNTNKKSLSSKIKIDINGVIYTISRTLARNSKNTKDVKATVTFYQSDKNISQKDKTDTEKLIIEKIGNVKDFIITSIVTQKSLYQGKSVGFAELSADEKRDILCKIARLDIYDNLFTDTTTKLKSLKTEIGKYNSSLKKFSSYGIDCVNIRLNINKKKTEITNKIENYEKELEEFNNNLEENKKTKYFLSNFDFSQINNDEKYETDKKVEIINSLKKQISKLEEINKDLKDDLEEIGDIKEIEDKYKKEKIKSIQKYNKDINSLKKKLWQDSSYDYNKFNQKKNDTELNKNIQDKKKLDEEFNKNCIEIKEIDKVLKIKIKEVSKDKVEEYERMIKDLETITNKKNICERDLIEYKQRLENLEEHEYDPDCEYCMQNSMTKEKQMLETNIKSFEKSIEKYNKEIKIHKEKTKVNLTKEYTAYLKDLEQNKIKQTTKELLLKDNEICKEKIKIIEIKIKELEKLKSNYDKFVESKDIQDKINELQDNIDELNNDDCEDKINFDKINETLIKNMTEIEKLNKRLKEEEIIYTEYISKKELYEKYELFNLNEKEIEIVQKKINNIREELIKLNTQLTINKENEIEFGIIEKNITDCNKIHDNYFIINDILKGGGLIETIMKDNLLPRFNDIVNNLFLKFGSRPVKVTYEKDKNKQLINIYDEQNRNTTRDGGYQTFLNNLIYRIAISEFNTNMKPNFMIIDEAFDSADSNNKQEMKKLINYLKSQHDWILVVSHDDDIKDTFDNIIEINKNDDNTKCIIY